MFKLIKGKIARTIQTKNFSRFSKCNENFVYNEVVKSEQITKIYWTRFARGVLPNLYYFTTTGAHKSATENHHFWEASKASPVKCPPLSQAKQEKFPSLHTPYWCIKKCNQNHQFWKASKASPVKWPPLSRAKFPFLHTPYRCIQKCHRKPPLLRGEQREPCKVPSSLSSEAREVSLSTYPLPVHSKVPQETTSFERRAKGAL